MKTAPSSIVDEMTMLARRIREAREERALSLRALAQSSGVSRSMLSDIERAAKSPTISLLSAIAEGLDLPLSALLDGGGPALSVIPRLIRAENQRTIRDSSGVQRRPTQLRS